MIRFGSIRTRQKISLSLLNAIYSLPLSKRVTRALMSYSKNVPSTELFGLNFKNPIGIAAGIDVNGEYIGPLSLTGCSFLEIGSITPLPEDSPVPVKVRIRPSERMVIEEYHINNKGILKVVENLRKQNHDMIVAANITKNSITDGSEEAVKDFEKCLGMLNDYVDMFIINLTGVTTDEQHSMQNIDYLSEILDRLLSLRLYFDHLPPILIKISDKIPPTQIDEILDYSQRNGIDGVVIRTDSYESTLKLVRDVNSKTCGHFPIIACGGISTPKQAKELLKSGASLIELYSAFFYQGASIVKHILKTLFPATSISPEEMKQNAD